MKKVAGGTTTRYIFSGAKVIAEYGNGSLTQEYVYAGGKRLVTVAADGSRTYHHPDHLSDRVRTDGNGDFSWWGGHYPFGEAWYDGTPGNKWKFTSYERDSESGLDYAMFRYDSTNLGRFMSPDRVAGSTIAPQTMNRYVYAANDPVNLTDPFGLYLCGPALCPVPFGGVPGDGRGGSPQHPGGSGGPMSAELRGQGGGGGLQIDKVSPSGNKVLEALDRLLQHLDPACKAWLLSMPGSDSSQIPFFREHLGQADITFNGDKNRIGGVTPPPNHIPGGYVSLINNKGAFFRDVTGTQPAFAGLSTTILSGGPQAQEFILLHELAHAFEVIGRDYDNPDAQAANNAEIEKHCSNTIQNLGK